MKLKHGVVACFVGASLGFNIAVFAADSSLKTEQQKFSYLAGVGLARQIENKPFGEVDVDALAQGIRDVMEKRPLKLSDEEQQEVQDAMFYKASKERIRAGELAEKNGKAFLEKNKAKPGVVTLADGLQYKILKQGDGNKPTEEDTVVANYRGTFINGKEFDSSYKRGKPATFPIKDVIEGWREALLLMPVGSKWQVFIPSQLAYRARGAGRTIGPNEVLVFEIELLSIVPSGQ